MLSIKIPSGGDPGKSPRRPIIENVRAAPQVSAESVGGRFLVATKNAIGIIEPSAVSIESKIITVRTLVEPLRFTAWLGPRPQWYKDASCFHGLWR